MNNLNAWQSRRANDSANIVERTKERFCKSEMLKKAQQEAKQERRDYRKRPLIWPLAVLSLAFRYCETFLWCALQH